MNFFGHAMIAQRNEATRGAIRAEFVLGAMLPDFASMLRTRPPRATLADVQQGLVFHHRTDDAFHGAPSFLEFSGQASSFLLHHGLSKGSARAVAHVGVELLLDHVFAAESAANEAYLRALECALAERVASHIHWQSSLEHRHFRQLCHNLSQRGAFRTDTPAEQVAERLRNILADRPRLAMDDAGQSVVLEWAVKARPAIESGAPRLLQEVEQRLHESRLA